MTTADRRRLAKYIGRLANTLGLRDWTITIHQDEPDTKDALASVSCVYGRRIADLWLSHGFENLEPHEQRHVLVHELLHVHMDPSWSLVQQALPGPLGLAAFDVFLAAYRERMEHSVDAIADAFASAFPLPE